MASVFGWVKGGTGSVLLNKREILIGVLEWKEKEPRQIHYWFILRLKNGDAYTTETKIVNSVDQAQRALEDWLALPEDNLPIIASLIEDGACRP